MEEEEPEFITVPCPACHGTGYHWNEFRGGMSECTRCDWNGTVEQRNPRYVPPPRLKPFIPPSPDDDYDPMPF